MGTGDLMVIPGIGLHFSVIEVVRVLVFSSTIGVIAGVILFFAKVVERNYRFPMIPFITAGVAIEILLI